MATLKEMWDETGREQQQRQEEFAKLSPKEQFRKKIINPIGIFLLGVMFAGIFGKEAVNLVLGFFFFVGVGMIYNSIKNEKAFIKVYYIVWGVLFSAPGTAGILAYLGF